MKNLNWQKAGEVYLLQNGNETLLSLSFKLSGISTFVVGGATYQVKKKGFINPVCYVMAGDKEILKLQTPLWGSNGTITFYDGAVFKCDYKSKGRLAVRFLEGGSEILVYSYVLEDNRPVTTFNVGQAILDAEKLLILAALGFVMFSTFFREMSAQTDILILS